MKNLRELPKLRDSLSFAYFENVRMERDGGALTAIDKNGKTHVPVAALGVLMLGPGTCITHDAVKTATESGASILFVGQGGDRCYAQGMGETRSSVRMLRQAQLHSDPAGRMAVVLKMYEKRFSESFEEGLSLQQIRGKEGVRVRTAYARASEKSGVEWKGRNYDRSNWNAGDPINRALSAAASCLYGVCHCAIVSAGYSTALGFIHTGKLLSFVYDIADLYRVDTIVPVAFDVAGRYKSAPNTKGLEREVRTACRDAFYSHKLLNRVISDIDDLMNVSKVELERAQTVSDQSDDPPGGLWDPCVGSLEGGVNYASDDP